MAEELLLVDGYNVLNAWPELEAFRDNLEHARDRLVDTLAGYSAYRDIRTVIVFDAHGVAGQERCEEVTPRLQVVFTREGETADSFIERLAYQMVRAGLGVYVVTSDRVEQQVILGAGAWRVPARELRSLVLEAQKEIGRNNEEAMGNRLRHEIGSRLSGAVQKRLDEMRRGR